MDYRDDARHVLDALQDPRVARALERAVRDLQIRAHFDQLRQKGVRVADAVEQLADEFFLSEERIRAIVYNKDDDIT